MSPTNRNSLNRILSILSTTIIALLTGTLSSAQQTASSHPTKIIIDSDIGDDVDDVFAIGLALTSPEVEILGISSAWGDTKLRARMIDRLLIETNATNIPVAEGIPTKAQSTFSQAALGQIRQRPDKNPTRKPSTSSSTKSKKIPATSRSSPSARSPTSAPPSTATLPPSKS